MRALFISYNGLLEPILPSQAIPYLKGLVREGIEFTLLTYEKNDDLERKGTVALRTLHDDLKKDGIEWKYLRYHKRPPLLSTLFDIIVGIFYAASIIARRRIDLVHVRGVTPGIILIVLAGIMRVKVLYDMRGLLAEEYVGGKIWKENDLAYRLVKAAERRLLKSADAVTMLTKKHMEYTKTLAYMSGRSIPMEVIPCCVDTVVFNYDDIRRRQIREKLGVSNNFVLMYPGKLDTFYLADEMVDFFSALSAIIPNAVFLVLTGNDPASIRRRAREINIDEKKIMILSAVEFSQMPLYTLAADAGIFFINPYKKFGSSPIKMGEFLACGVPVVINPGVGDSEEIVREARCGIVVDAFNPSCYRSGAAELMRLMGEGDALRARCRATAVERISLKDGIAKYASIYRSLMKGDIS